MTIVLSGKEVSGLAARVLGAAGVPIGCVGAAAEMVDFLEYFSGNGLSLLDACKEDLLQKRWIPPQVLASSAGAAFCDAGGESLLFSGPPLADWLTAMTFEEGATALLLRNVEHLDFLSALPVRVAGQGLLCVAIASVPGRGVECSIGFTGDQSSWVAAGFELRRKTEPLDGRALDARPDAAIEALQHIRSVLSDGVQSRSDLASALSSIFTFVPSACCVLFAARGSGRSGIGMLHVRLGAMIRENSGTLVDSGDLSRTRRAVRSEGRPLSDDTWRSLMTFANKGLIPTSEHSRAGAG